MKKIFSVFLILPILWLVGCGNNEQDVQSRDNPYAGRNLVGTDHDERMRWTQRCIDFGGDIVRCGWN